MYLTNYRRNALGGIDADRTMGDEIVPYTLSEKEIKDLKSSVVIAPYKKPEPTELDLKLNAFEFKGVVCSVHKNDRDGWANISDMLREHMEDGYPFEPFTFYMENGNSINIDTEEEWKTLKRMGRKVVFQVYSQRSSN